MTNWLWLFLAFYILVGQPAILWRMLNNCSLYQLAGLNAGIFFIAWIISAMCKSAKKQATTENNENKVKLTEKSEEKVSRIEDVNGVAIVEVQNKKEIVVETSNNEDQDADEEENEDTKALTQDTEEVDDKPEEKKSEKPMRETVSIPKIVQPISWWYQVPKRKRERNIGQRFILLLTLILAAVIAVSLWEFLGNRWIAIALFLWWMLYLVIGKLFDINGFYNAKKLFTNWIYFLLIIAGIGYWAYAMQSEDASLLPTDLWEKVITYIKDLFKSDEEVKPVVEEDTSDAIYIFEGTGEVIENTGENEVLWDTENVEIDEWLVENTEPEIEVQPQIQPEVQAENQASNLSPEEAKKQVTMWEAVKSLLAGATLSTKTNTTFKYVSKSNELYPYFKTAQERWMIGTDTDPSKIISCETYITMKWILEWRNVGNYSKSEIKSAYWNKATELWKLNGCTKWAYVTRGNL